MGNYKLLLYLWPFTRNKGEKTIWCKAIFELRAFQRVTRYFLISNCDCKIWYCSLAKWTWYLPGYIVFGKQIIRSKPLRRNCPIDNFRFSSFTKWKQMHIKGRPFGKLRTKFGLRSLAVIPWKARFQTLSRPQRPGDLAVWNDKVKRQT